MRGYILRRLLTLVPVLTGISLCVFLVMKLVPGDVVSGILGVEQTPELRAAWEKKLGLDQPAPVQYLKWMGNVLRGNFGESFRTGAPVFPEILNRFKITAELAFLACLASLLMAIPLGILSALRRNRPLDKAVRVLALLGVSVPNFASAMLLILLLSKAFGYFTPVKYLSPMEDLRANLEIMVLPALILGATMAGAVMRMTRSSVLEVLRQDFIRAVRGRGAPERVTVFRHALKNACIPIVTLSGMQVGTLLGGTVVIEQIFSIPGLGQLVLTGISQRDYPVVQGCVLFIAFVYVMLNLLVDLLYTWIDPRIQYD
ncbi:MAG: ABC transporter permease [Synergistaceae bacterium]|jgi:peptide/nickel transport system permease protein|nr:ABC transporter permease [Synergistaceae bacterium]